jgi:CBS domain-containing membrane protein
VNIKTKLIAVLTCFAVIWLTASFLKHFIANPQYPLLVASMGATAVIVFILPTSPLAQPWPVFGGHLVSAVIGVACTQAIPDIALASACAAGGSIFAMLVLRCLHPPGAATALAPVLSGHSSFDFVLIPVGLNYLIFLMLAVLINRYLLGHPYPTPSLADNIKQDQKQSPLQQQTGVTEQDLQQTLEKQDVYIDISASQLGDLIMSTQRQLFQRATGNITCADIMDRHIMTVEYGTDVDTAWHIMHTHKLKAMPVLDKAHRVIGMLSWDDFFNRIDANDVMPFLQKFRAFVKPSADVHTQKPEAVGHLMDKSVAVLPETAHIVELIPLISEQNCGYVPIVNHEKRLVGVVNSNQLVAAVYRQQILDANLLA